MCNKTNGFWLPPALIVAATMFFLAAGGKAEAHQVPSLTVEALFSEDRSYTLRINLDPRLFITDQPSSLPPVPIEWYRDQKPDELAVTHEKAAAYLRKALSMQLGDATRPVENCEFQPMDGATNMPLAEDTKEVHLLAESKGRVPEGQNSFALTLSHDANVSMILINSFEGTMERRPNVVFPGESSRPFLLAFPAQPVAPPAVPETGKSVADAESGGRTGAMLWMAACAALLLLLILRVVRRRRRKV